MATRRQRMQDQLAIKEAQLALLNTTITSLISNDGDVASYKFNSGDGEQQASRKNLGELRKEANILEGEIDSLYLRLEGRNIVSLKMRRIL